jgi:hypothetical protein
MENEEERKRCLFSIGEYGNNFSEDKLDILLTQSRNITCIFTPINICFNCLEDEEKRITLNNMLRRHNEHIYNPLEINTNIQPELEGRTTINFNELNNDYEDFLMETIYTINAIKERILIKNCRITKRNIIDKFYYRHCKKRKFYICCNRIFISNIIEIETDIFEVIFSF